MTAANVVVRPFRHASLRGRLLAPVVFAVPVLATVLLLALDGGSLVPALVLAGLTALGGGVLVLVLLRCRIELGREVMRVHRLTGTQILPLEDVRRAVVRRLQSPDETTSQRHLFFSDGTGRTVLRMSDRWWTTAQMAQVAERFPVPVESQDEPVYRAELRRSAPESLYWVELHPWLWRAVEIAAVGSLSVLIAVVATAAL